MSMYDATTEPLSMRSLLEAIEQIRNLPPLPRRYEVSPEFMEWLTSHSVKETEALGHVFGVPVDVRVDWVGMRAEPVYPEEATNG